MSLAAEEMRDEAPFRVTVAEEQFRLIVSSIEDYGIFMLDVGGHIASWNAGAQELKGYRAEEVIGKHISIFYTPEDRVRRRPEHLLRLAAAQTRVEDQGWRVRKDGTCFWADVVITALRGSDGELKGFAKVTRDLTSRKETEDQLRQSEERLRLIVASVHDYALFLLDPEGNVATWNPGAERIKGYRAEEIIGVHFSRFYPQEDIDAQKPQLELAGAIHGGRFEDEGFRLRKDGSRFWANVVISAVRDASGKLIGFVKITRDLTERKSLEQERLRVVKAQEAVRLRDEFLSVASHELKTPLTAMLLQLETIRERAAKTDEGLAKRIAKASEAGMRLSHLIEALLDVTRISNGRIELNREPSDLLEMAREIVGRFRESASKAECSLSFKTAHAVLGSWDRLRIEQVLTNLLSNAIKYAPGQPIEVSVCRDGDMAILEVQDHGPGIPESDTERIFDRFERAVSKSHFGGLGLGLYVARQIAEAHGGTIGVGGGEDGGACFTVRLPIAPST